MRSTEQRARRAEKERERRAAESPACRQARLASDKASTRRRRQALTLESDITAKRRNSARLARLASDKAATRIHGQALESSIAENQHCALSIVVRLQLLLRLGVRVVTPLIMMLLSTSYGFTHVPAPSEL